MQNSNPQADLTLLNDRDLLRRFVLDADQGAFAEIVRRYQSLVLGVSRRVVGHEADVDDVFQATFLALARRPKDIRQAMSLSSWLYTVAWRTSWKLVKHRRKHPVEPLAAHPSHDPEDPLDRIAAAQDCVVLDEELHSLPAKYREVLVMTYFADQTSQQIADQLSVSKGTVDGRIREARNMLRVRLARRGVAIGVLAVAAGISCGNSAAASSKLLEETIQLGAQTLNGSVPGTTDLSHLEPLIRSEAAMLSSKVVLTGALCVSAIVGIAGMADEKPDPPEQVSERLDAKTEVDSKSKSLGDSGSAEQIEVVVSAVTPETKPSADAAPQPDRSSEHSLELSEGAVVVYQHDENIRRVDGYDPNVLQVEAMIGKPNMLVLRGKKAGTAKFDVTGASSDEVTVTVNIGRSSESTDPFAGSGEVNSAKPASAGPHFTTYPDDARPVEKWMHEVLEQPVANLDFPGDTPLREVLNTIADQFSTQYGATESGDFRLQFYTDAAELALEGIESLEDVTVADVNFNGMALENALKLILDQTRDDIKSPVELTYVIQNEVMMVTTVDKAKSDSMLTTRVYPVGHLLHLDYGAFSPDAVPPGGYGMGYFSVPAGQFGGGGFGGMQMAAGGEGIQEGMGAEMGYESGGMGTEAKVPPTLESVIMDLTTPPCQWVEIDAEGGVIRRAGDNLVIRQTFAGHREIVKLLNMLSKAAEE